MGLICNKFRTEVRIIIGGIVTKSNTLIFYKANFSNENNHAGNPTYNSFGVEASHDAS